MVVTSVMFWRLALYWRMHVGMNFSLDASLVSEIQGRKENNKCYTPDCFRILLRDTTKYI